MLLNSHLYEKILDITNGGLDLINECYPQIREQKIGTFFKIRNEKTASAHIINNEGIYLLKDFGGYFDKARDGIHVFADHNGITVDKAVYQLAGRYGLAGEKTSLGPSITSCPATNSDYEEGKRVYEFKDKPTAAELAFLAPKATAKTLEQLNWKSVNRVVCYKDHKQITISSTNNYPIFAREMHDVESGALLGYKIYQPRAIEKKYKFTYYPSGMQPGNYWHGLYELKQATNNGKEKVDSAIVCSGERDAIVACSMGNYPIWGNSETALLTDNIYDEIFKYVKRLYLIPDIDATGKAMGWKNMIDYPKISVVWLPEEMKKNTSDQHKSCKDLRDWAQLHPTKKDFQHLMAKARPYQFWDWNRKKGVGSVNQDYLLHFLKIHGFARILNPLTRDYDFVRVQNHTVSRVTTKDMRNFIIDSVAEQPAYVHNVVLNSKCTELKRLEDVAVREFDFANSTKDSQMFFYGDKQFLVTADKIEEVDEESKVYVKEEKISQHEVNLLPPLFTWEKTDMTDEGGAPIYRIGDIDNSCKLLCFLCLSSMIHWRRYESTSENTFEEDVEENRVLAVKMFHIGYMLHRRRTKSNDWAPIMMDYNTPYDAESANGGVGKSFIYQDVLPSAGYNVVKVRKQSKRPSDADFLFDQVTEDTDIVYFDECAKDFHYEDLNDVITGDMVVNKKNKSMFTIPYSVVPKMAFLTNYVPRDFDASSDRRHIYDVSSDYFHQKTLTNGYEQTRTIMSEFGGALMQDDYSAEDWNRDLNLLMQIEQFYLSVIREGRKLTPPMSNIMRRHDQGALDESFLNWADMYFCDATHLNTAIPLSEMANNFNASHFAYTPIDKKTLKKEIRLFAEINGLEYNPVDVCNDKKTRRIKFRNGTFQDEKIYLRGNYDP